MQGGRPLPLSELWSKLSPGDPDPGSLPRLASYFPPHFLFPPPGLLPRHRAIGPGIRPQAPPASVALACAPPAIWASQGWGGGGTRASPARCEEEPHGTRPPADARLRWVPPRGPAVPGRSTRGRANPAGGRARGQALRAGAAPPAHLRRTGVLPARSRSCSPGRHYPKDPSLCVFTCHTLMAMIRFRLHPGEPTMCRAPRATGTRRSRAVSAVRSSLSLLLC